MPISVDVQATISQRYAQLADSVTHGKRTVEKAMLGPGFYEHTKAKLETFEYDPLTVIMQKITVSGDAILVRAEYVGIHGHNAVTVDRWVQSNGDWVLASRTSL
jgi:hypothetical protein